MPRGDTKNYYNRLYTIEIDSEMSIGLLIASSLPRGCEAGQATICLTKQAYRDILSH
jgi:hypothetical protein